MATEGKSGDEVSHDRSEHHEQDFQKPSGVLVKDGDIAAQLIGDQHIVLTEEDVSAKSPEDALLPSILQYLQATVC